MAGLGKMMKQMAKLQKRMTAVQEQLAVETIEVSRAGGAVSVRVTLAQEVQALKLDPEFLKEDAATVEATILEAVQAALAESKTRSEAAMQGVQNEIAIPGLR
jgi:nucleoid-associated protein EbfC